MIIAGIQGTVVNVLIDVTELRLIRAALELLDPNEFEGAVAALNLSPKAHEASIGVIAQACFAITSMEDALGLDQELLPDQEVTQEVLNSMKPGVVVH